MDVTKLSLAELYDLAYPVDSDAHRWKALAEALLTINRKLDAIAETLRIANATTEQSSK